MIILSYSHNTVLYQSKTTPKTQFNQLLKTLNENTVK